MIPLIVPCLNRFDLFTEMMETVDTDIRPFVIDQWRNNRGVSGAWNLGMQRVLEAGYKHAVVCNDDIKFYQGSLEKIFNLLVDENVALVSPRQVKPGLKNPVKFEDPISMSEDIRPGADFFCFAVNIPMLTESVGWFDENFFPAYFEDNDMHYRMMKFGLKSYVYEGAPVFHEGSKTQNYIPKKPVTNDFDFESNKLYLSKKWGGPVDHGTLDRPWNHPELELSDWPGSHKYGGEDKSEIFDSIDWKAENPFPQIAFSSL